MRAIGFLILIVILTSCSRSKKHRELAREHSPTEVAREELIPTSLPGKDLAEKYCSSCHAFVPPERLPKKVWREDVLPLMGHLLGIYKEGSRPQSLFDMGISGTIVRNANVYPEHPLLAREDWEKIVNYFTEHAPDSIPPPVRDHKIRIGLPHFRYRPAPTTHRPPYTAMVKILPDKRGLVFSDGKGPRSILTFLSPDLQERQSIVMSTTPVQLTERSNEIILTTIGRGILPNDAPDGTLQRLTRNWPDPHYKPADIILKDLQRPVSIAYGDLNDDGLEDLVVCEFGNKTGRLSWYAGNGDGTYSRTTLRNKPGAIRAIISDANRDGRPDIYVLMAQGDEGLFLYENQGNGTFNEKRLLQFSPLSGSQYFELADFNKDGLDDIIYVCGDNADHTPILKQYHGIYIYLNEGKETYRQAYFYPVNGAYKAMARDFDLDGDLDIAAISHFPDYRNHPEESFVYLRNKGNLRFDDYSFPQASDGRWIVMDAGDLDGDGDIDLALGSFVYFLPDGDTTGLGRRWLSQSPSVVILENTIR